MHKHIQVRGARDHNLKGVNIDLPRDKLIVITGLSGSGKSSLAFDTIVSLWFVMNNDRIYERQ